MKIARIKKHILIYPKFLSESKLGVEIKSEDIPKSKENQDITNENNMQQDKGSNNNQNLAELSKISKRKEFFENAESI